MGQETTFVWTIRDKYHYDIMRSPELANRPGGLRITSDVHMVVIYEGYLRLMAVNKAKHLPTAVKRGKTLVGERFSAGSSGGGDALQN